MAVASNAVPERSAELCCDYVVVGAGSAGCIVAARLAAAGHSVVVLEAGDAAAVHPETFSADGFKEAFANDALMWHRMSTPQAALCGRRAYLGSGRGMGGSGAVNGMVYTRGDRRDFAAWPAGWQWDDLMPAFAALEQQLGVQPRPPTRFVQRFIDAATATGLRRKDGLNDGELGGYVGCNDMNFAGAERRSAYRAYLHAHSHPHLRVLERARVLRVVFDAARAVAVEVRRHGRTQRVQVKREVILCAGALETPRLLMLSGVGPRAALAQVGLPLVLDAPGVGQNLQDHPNVCLFFRAAEAVDFSYPQVYAFDAARRLPEVSATDAPDSCYVCYAAPASIRHSMLRMLPILALPAPLYRLRPLREALRALINLLFRLAPVQRFVAQLFGVVVILGKPSARGQVRLMSADPNAPAAIDPAYYATPQDRATMIAAVAKAVGIGERIPGARLLSRAARSPSAVWRWIAHATMTTFHYAGSCRMGTDADSPVAPDLRIKGLDNVRVADASVMPEIPVSALNAPSMMIGYRAADFILRGETP